MSKVQRMKRQQIQGVILAALAAVLAGAIVVVPMLLMIFTSLKSRVELFRVPPALLPERWLLTAYVEVWARRSFVTYITNSAVVGAVATLIACVAAVLAGYGFSRYQFRGRRVLLMAFLLSQMVPALALVVPYFRVLGHIGLYNTRIGLIIAHATFALPFCTWMAYGYFRAIPTELDDAARVDGCGPLRTLVTIIAPLLRPGVIAMMMFSFLQSWNEYVFALNLAADERMFTVPVGIGLLFGEYGVSWNEVMAASVIGAIPVVVVYIALETKLTGGMVEGALRG